MLVGIGTFLGSGTPPPKPPIDRNSLYYRQVQLLMRVLPFVAKEECFALKGGTAINLFIRNLPRLSVDIDLSYQPLDSREKALIKIDEALGRIKAGIEKGLPEVRVHHQAGQDDSKRMIVSTAQAQIKIELSPVLRGSVFPAELRTVCAEAEKEFGFAEILVVSFADLYAGKLCAALDRQHPRDLFDVGLLFENEGLTRDLVRTFIVYLISHNRPIAELLDPEKKGIKGLYENEFVKMTAKPVSLEKLEATREKLITDIRKSLTEDDKKFLLSFKAREPEWNLLGLDGVDQLPAVRWKLINLEKMGGERHEKALHKLEEILRT